MKRKTICTILLCGFFLLSSNFIAANAEIIQSKDTDDDVAYYEDGVVHRDDSVTFIDTMPGIDITSMSCDCTESALIVTLTVKENFPMGRIEGYTYGLEVYTNSNYGLITINYETDYGINNPGGWANLGSPEFSVSENTLVATIENLVIDESTIYLLDAFAKFESGDGALYVDWLPDGDEKGDDETDDSSENEIFSDSSPVNNSNETIDTTQDLNEDTINNDDTDDTGLTQLDEPSETPGFSIFFVLIAFLGLLIIHKII